MAGSQQKVRRGLVIERVAIQRCTSKEARRVLQNYFVREYAVNKEAGRKAAITKGKKKYVDWKHELLKQWKDWR